MTKYKKPIFVLVMVLIGVVLTVTWVERPKRIRQEFVGHLYHERYDSAALMLSAPCVIGLEPDGSLTLVDQRGNSTVVPATKLPFKVGGGDPQRPGDISMTALGRSTNGILHTPPVIIYLSVDGGKIRIENVN
ncbi:MAG: hypothetical protein P8N76_11565 [Pirellulaceae bacterium]|nr:hypothetical protein [Pirellulaceae bacterium]